MSSWRCRGTSLHRTPQLAAWRLECGTSLWVAMSMCGFHVKKMLQKGCALALRHGDGRPVVMRADDDVVAVRPLEHGVEEGARVGQPVLLDEGGVGNEAIAPVHADGVLGRALNEEERLRIDLHGNINSATPAAPAFL